MNRVEPVDAQYAAGLKNGANMAAIVINRFPDGFSISTETGLAIWQATDAALAHAVKNLAANGIGPKYIKSFERGYRIGLRNTFTEYARTSNWLTAK